MHDHWGLLANLSVILVVALGLGLITERMRLSSIVGYLFAGVILGPHTPGLTADPKMTTGLNKLWIRFFILSVYATMYVRDHTRPALYDAFGMNITDYDYAVFRLTTEISRQCFPVTVDCDTPQFRARMEDMLRAMRRLDTLRGKPGFVNKARRGLCMAQAGWTFARLFFQRTERNPLPATVRLAPAW